MIRFSFHKKLKAVGGEMKLQLDCEVQQGQLLTLYGESGAGKTSVLRMLAGLMSPDVGQITVNGNTWLDTQSKVDLRPQYRRIGFVFQDYALFPNMTVRQNLEFALDKNQDNNQVNDLIEIIELGDLQHRRPETLSGGQQQRIALARALVRQPELLLLDEPLSALDYAMRVKLQDYILRVHRQFNLTTILVSHEISEVFKMSDYVLELVQGRVARQGSPSAIFSGNGLPEGQFKMVGDVVSLVQNGQPCLRILVGNQTVTLPAPGFSGQDLKVGDRVVLSADLANGMVKRIN